MTPPPAAPKRVMEKDRHRQRRNAAKKQRSVRVAASRSSHCRCDYCVTPYERHEKHRNRPDYMKEEA